MNGDRIWKRKSYGFSLLHWLLRELKYIWFNILDAELSTRTQNTVEAILQIPSSLCLTPHEKVTNTDKKKQPQVNGKKTRQFNIVWSGLTNEYIYIFDSSKI
jgi:hypothetical protein